VHWCVFDTRRNTAALPSSWCLAHSAGRQCQCGGDLTRSRQRARAATRLQGDKDAIACVHLQPGHALPWPRQQLRAPREGRRWGLRLLQARAPHMLRGQA